MERNIVPNNNSNLYIAIPSKAGDGLQLSPIIAFSVIFDTEEGYYQAIPIGIDGIVDEDEECFIYDKQNGAWSCAGVFGCVGIGADSLIDYFKRNK